MASPYSQLIQRIQEQAQANIPVTPNNGNPNGAYNMPQQEQAKPVLSSPYLTYSAANPSPYMQAIQNLLNRNVNLTVPSEAQTGATDAPVNLPILPARR